MRLSSLRTPSILAALLSCSLALAPAASRATGDLVLDDFSTGPAMGSNTVGPTNHGIINKVETGSTIIGGSRSITLDVPNSPHAQASLVQVRPMSITKMPSIFVMSNGYRANARVDVIYGASPGSLTLDLTSYDRLRFTFEGLQAALNFNVVVIDPSNIAGQDGCNLEAFASAGTTTVDLRLSDFMKNNKQPVDFHHIHAIDLIFQPANIDGSPNFGLNLFDAIPSTDPAGDIVCGPIHNRWKFR